jgi:hypothetical protein
VLQDFKRALARVQSDFGFYIDCQTNPAVALAGYNLTSDERLGLSDPEKLADVLKRAIGIQAIKITISGTHDWVNRAVHDNPAMADADRDAKVATQIKLIEQASTKEGRTEATLRLMELIG